MLGKAVTAIPNARAAAPLEYAARNEVLNRSKIGELGGIVAAIAK